VTRYVYLLIALAVVIVGYYGVKVSEMIRDLPWLLQPASQTVAMDSTFHVPSGSAVYLDSASVAPIGGVVVVTTRFRSGRTPAVSIWYTAGPATDSAMAARVAAMRDVYGVMHGRYDGREPVRIDLAEGDFAATRPRWPDGFLKMAPREAEILLYLPP
jgi:hypothetical protein